MFAHKQDSHFQAVPVKDEKRLRRARAPPQRLKHPAEQPILRQCLQLSPTLWSPWRPSRIPTLLVPVPNPCGDHGYCRVVVVVGWISMVTGFCLLFWKIWNASLFHGMFTSWQEPKLLSMRLCKPWNMVNRLPALSMQSEPPPLCPWPHSSKRQDATDWIDAEDFPFLWFFCLFCIYTIIKKSLVLAGKFKNKTKQRNHPPLAYSSSSKTWQSLFSTSGIGIEGWELHSKKRWKGWGCSF